LRLVVNKASLKNIDLKIDKEIFYELKDILPNYIQEDAK
jgi:phage-related tail fiber protein